MLNVHSYFSFKYGIFSIKQLLDWGVKNRYRALTLTDVNSTAGNLDFVRQAKKRGIKPLLGIDFRNGATQQFIGIAKNNEGYFQLNTFLSRHLHEEIPIPSHIEQVTNCFNNLPSD